MESISRLWGSRLWGAGFAVALCIAVTPAAFADEAQVLQRLDRLENRIDSLEGEVKAKDSKIESLEKAVQDRDAKIEALEKTRAEGAKAGAPPAAAGSSKGTADGAAGSTDTKTQAKEVPASAPKVTTKGGLKVESEDGAFSFQAIGRLNVDAAFYDQDKSRMGDGIQLRRARLGATGKMFNDWVYKLELDFGRDTGAGTVAVKEAWIKYIGWAPAEFLVGNVPVPFSLEDYTADLFVTFIERALPTPVFAPERLLGAVGGYYESNWSFAAGFYGRSADDPANVSITGPGPNCTTANPCTEGDQQFVSTARVTFDPVLEKDKLVHLGLGILFKNPSDQPITFSTRPESNVTAVRFLNTGTIANLDRLIEYDPELALIYGPASLQGEYFYVPVTRTQPNGTSSTPDVTLNGWYAQASYFLTGESRNYNPKIAKFDRVTPNNNLGHGGPGAIELAARVSQLDLDDGPQFQHGTERDYTLGVNWYVNPYIRFMVNYVFVRNNASATGNCPKPGTPPCNLLPGSANDSYDDPQILEFRAQVDW
jgi:phosphate-selective porin OprO/OprP